MKTQERYDKAVNQYNKAVEKFDAFFKNEKTYDIELDNPIKDKQLYNRLHNEYLDSIKELAQSSMLRICDLKDYKFLVKYQHDFSDFLFNFWIKYIQHIESYSGKLWPISDFNPWQEQIEEANDYFKLKALFESKTINLEKLREMPQAIKIKSLNGEIIELRSYRLWSKIKDVINTEILGDKQYELQMVEIKATRFRKNGAPLNYKDFIVKEMAEAAIKHLFQWKEFNSNTKPNTKMKRLVAEIFNHMRVPTYRQGKGKPTYGTHTAEHITKYLKN